MFRFLKPRTKPSSGKPQTKFFSSLHRKQTFPQTRLPTTYSLFLTPKPKPLGSQTRKLNVHEYQSHDLMRAFGIRVPEGKVASTTEEADAAARELGTQDVIIKAQILAGGRGKGYFDSGLKGGVHICPPDEVKKYAMKMLGHRLITKQTDEKGKLVSKVYICARRYIRHEYYFAILMDRSFKGPAIVASSEGGVDIETVAREFPESIIKEPIDIDIGLTKEQATAVAAKLGFKKGLVDDAVDQMIKLYNFFIARDATLVEINPLVETAEGQVLCLDAKVNFDHNALFRQQELQQMRDISQEDQREVEASKFDLNYIGLFGNIGCLVNGAGLAMATMDIIKLKGGEPANFLDVGGGASERQVKEAFRILNSDPNVRAILVNIFGGIMRCDIIALGIINACKDLKLNIPIVIRLRGTNVEKAKELIDHSGLRLIAADDLDQAAVQSVKVAKIVDMANEAKLHVSFELPI